MGYRGELGEEHARFVSEKVPEAVSIQRWALQLDPGRLAMVFGPGTDRDEIAACLQDAASFLAEARYALAEAHAHLTWHKKIASPPDDVSALFWSQFYVDDAVLRIYSTAETIAAFTDLYLETRTMKQLLPRKVRDEVRGKSRIARLNKLLLLVGSHGELQSKVAEVVSDSSWEFVTDYRNKWVHEQRPRVAGLGISYERRRRWQRDEEDKTGNTWVLGIGGGDPADVRVEALLEETDSAYVLLRRLVEQCCHVLDDEIAKREPRFPHRLEANVEQLGSGPLHVKGKRIVPQQIDSVVRD